MSGKQFWRWYDRGARTDFAGTLLGYVFDWKGWIAGTVAGGGGATTFLKAAIDGRSPLDVWVLAVVVMAALAVLMYFSISALAKLRKPKIADGLGYLRDEDAELGGAVRDMAWMSAWGKWYTAQSLANSAPNPVNEQFIMGAATHLVLDKLTNGQLEVRGRKPGQIDYEPIPPTHWRSSALHMIQDSRSLWKMILIPRGGAEITPDGKVIGRDQGAVQRTDQLASYDSLIVNARQFEKLWPRKDRDTDIARKLLLKKAKKAGVDPAEIAKLSQD
jgi:hypothetical protein